MIRYRLISEQGGERHEQGYVLLDLDDAREWLEVEASLHRAWGWQVEQVADLRLCCRQGAKERVLRIEARSPFNDC